MSFKHETAQTQSSIMLLNYFVSTSEKNRNITVIAASKIQLGICFFKLFPDERLAFFCGSTNVATY